MIVKPFLTVTQIPDIFESLEIPYALGGSLASSIVGEPRATINMPS